MLFEKHYNIFLLFILWTTNFGLCSGLATCCANGYTLTGNYCYMYFAANQTTQRMAVKQCALQRGVLPTFNSQQEYVTFTNQTPPSRQAFWIGYKHKVGFANPSDTVSIYDGQVIKVVTWDSGEPNFYSGQWCFVNSNHGVYDYDCNTPSWSPYDYFATMCQQAQSFNCTPMAAMSCSAVCQVDGGRGHLYSTSFLDCQQNNLTKNAYARLGYAFLMHIPGLTEAIYQMASNVNNRTVMVYGVSKMTTMLSQNYTVQSVFFVSLSNIVNNMEKYSLLLNSANVATITDSIIVKYSDPMYANLTNSNWIDTGAFYLYQNQTNGTCNVYPSTSTSTTFTLATTTTVLVNANTSTSALTSTTKQRQQTSTDKLTSSLPTTFITTTKSPPPSPLTTTTTKTTKTQMSTTESTNFTTSAFTLSAATSSITSSLFPRSSTPTPVTTTAVFTTFNVSTSALTTTTKKSQQTSTEKLTSSLSTTFITTTKSSPSSITTANVKKTQMSTVGPTNFTTSAFRTSAVTSSITSSLFLQNSVSENDHVNKTAVTNKDCANTEWSEFSVCSQSCGSASTKFRTRTIFRELNGTCAETNQVIYCDDLPKCNPMSATAQYVSAVLQAIGCIWLITACSLCILITLLLNRWTTDRVIHTCEEMSLIMAHVLIALIRNKTQNIVLCTWASIGIQYSFVAHFCFMALECFEMFAIASGIVAKSDFLTKLHVIFVGWGSSLIITTITASTSYHHYVSDFSCWINLENPVAYGTLLPVMFCACVSVVLIEAAGQFSNIINLNFDDPGQFVTAKINQRSLVALIPLHIAAWIFGQTAVFYQNVGLFSTVTALHITLGSCIFCFHVLANSEGRRMVLNLWNKIRYQKV